MNLRFFKVAAASWRAQSWPVRVIRFWLGFTWLFAAWHKATDPGFLTAGSTTFIGTQLTGYSTQSPIGFVFENLIDNSVKVGIFVMLSEFAIGLATIFWGSSIHGRLRWLFDVNRIMASEQLPCRSLFFSQ